MEQHVLTEVFLERLNAFKKQQNTTLYAISDVSGIDEGDISKYLNGKISPTLPSLLDMVDGMGGKLIVVPKEEKKP